MWKWKFFSWLRENFSIEMALQSSFKNSIFSDKFLKFSILSILSIVSNLNLRNDQSTNDTAKFSLPENWKCYSIENINWIDQLKKSTSLMILFF